MWFEFLLLGPLSIIMPTYIIMQLVHSCEVNHRICQSENRDVHRGETKRNAPIVLLNDNVSLFLVLYQVFLYYFYSSQMFQVHIKKIISQLLFNFLNSYEMCKIIAFFKLLVS